MGSEGNRTDRDRPTVPGEYPRFDDWQVGASSIRLARPTVMSSLITRQHKTHHSSPSWVSYGATQPVHPNAHRPSGASNLASTVHECEDQCHYCQGPETD